jgi:hypothetical protein
MFRQPVASQASGGLTNYRVASRAVVSFKLVEKIYIIL